MTKLNTINCEELMTEPLKPIEFVVDNLITQGLFILAGALGGVLEKQIKSFKSQHNDLKIIIIDTLQKIRSDSPDNTYATDYKELSILKSIADKNTVAIVLVHHLRKTKDADPFNMISGTTGLSGCVDGSFVLSESKRGSRNATLYCVGRDIENREIELKFDSETHRWISDEIISEKDNKNKIFIEKIFDFMIERKKFVGTATELAALLAPRFETEIFPNRLTRDLVQNAYGLADYRIKFSSERSHGMRRIRLELLSGDGSDGKNPAP